jgi:hypothetical protein
VLVRALVLEGKPHGSSSSSVFFTQSVSQSGSYWSATEDSATSGVLAVNAVTPLMCVPALLLSSL